VGFADTAIYSRSLELVRLGQAVIQQLPSGCGFLADQLRRSTSSVALNFAEGYAKPSAAEQRRFFTIARASAQECFATLDVAKCLGAISPELHARGTDLADHLIRMLVKFRRR
jgi:four helix bundle protein